MHIGRMKTLAKYLPSYQMSRLGALRITDEVGNESYSIMGVMADIYLRATRQGKWQNGNPTHSDKLILITQEGPWSIELPLEVVEWYGLKQEHITRLWEAQARGFSFEQIAKAIERWVEKEGK